MTLWSLAFRPFFLFGSGYAIVAILVWVSFLTSGLPHFTSMDPIIWHSHEMVFGFVAAIIAGFILTAVQNWTGISGVKGIRLRLLFILWISARILMFIPAAPPLLVAIVDLSFFPCLTFLLAPFLRSPEIGTEKLFYVLFFLFFAGNFLVHLEGLGLDHFLLSDGTARVGVRLGLDSAILVTLFMGGRVIPFFTESSVARIQPRSYAAIERITPFVSVAFVIGDIFLRNTVILAVVAFIAALVHVIRLFGWQVRRVRRVPLIWVLHLGYFWIVCGFALTGFAALRTIPFSIATHAFTVGGLGLIIYGMVSRVSLGHTGRRLRPTAWTVGGYILLALAAAVRILGPFVPSLSIQIVWLVAGTLWSVAFLIFVIQYAPILTRPRVDGRPG